MPSSPSPPIPGLKVPELPEADLGFPLRHSRRAKESAGEAIKGAYVMGAADGSSIGYSVGYTAGDVAGTVKGAVVGSVLTGVSFGLLLFVAFLIARLLKGTR